LDNNDRFIVAQMLSGIELYIGLVDDAIFGKTIVFGKGVLNWSSIKMSVILISMPKTKRSYVLSI
jgi:acyl-CoA synthetase (NDP forming)